MCWPVFCQGGRGLCRNTHSSWLRSAGPRRKNPKRLGCVNGRHVIRSSSTTHPRSLSLFLRLSRSNSHGHGSKQLVVRHRLAGVGVHGRSDRNTARSGCKNRHGPDRNRSGPSMRFCKDICEVHQPTRSNRIGCRICTRAFMVVEPDLYNGHMVRKLVRHPAPLRSPDA